MRILGSLILSGAFALAACAHAPEAEVPANAAEKDSTAPAPMAPTSATPPSAAEVTVENLLRWPLEGPAGVDKVKAGLRQVLQMRPLIAQQFIGNGPVRLSDGYVLTFAETKGLSDTASIGLEQTPCVSPAYAQQLIGAVQSPTIRDMHGVDLGKTYSVTRNGIWVIFDTTPHTYRCVRLIHIHPAKESNS